MDDTFSFWAKTNPYKSLIHHMIDVGCMAKELISHSSLETVSYELAKSLDTTKLSNTIACFAALHDLGKCHPSFQNMAPDLSFVKDLISKKLASIQISHEYRHEIGTSSALNRIMKELELPKKTINMLSTVLELHHQKDKINRNVKIYFEKEYWEKHQEELFKLIVNLFDADFEVFKKCSDHDAVAVLIWGITILADWLASGQDAFNLIDSKLCIKDYYEKARCAATLSINNCGFQTDKKLPVTNFCGLWKTFNNEMLRPLQNACTELTEDWVSENNVPGLVIIEAPMGEGKTEAALYLTTYLMEFFHKSGFYVALPTSATSNQMYGRISSLLLSHEIEGARLLHSMAWLLDHETPESKIDSEDSESAMAWLAPLRRGLLSQYAVGTVDQIMMSVLKIKYGILRMLGISSKVIVIDEVHAYDTYMYSIIERLLNWCAVLNIPVIILSATLPKKRRKSLVDAYGGNSKGFNLSDAYPLITTTSPNEDIKQKEILGTFMKSKVSICCMPLLGKWEEVANFTLEKAKSNGCICVIVNTVKEAQQLYKTLAERNTDINLDILLFHARYPAEDRQYIEKTCLDYFGKNSLLSKENPNFKHRPERAILVATQVVEQSLDLDFDLMITAVAPIDLLLQRMGRLHRHMDRKRPEKFQNPIFIILTYEGDIQKTPTGYVYNNYILKKTIEQIRNIKEICLPSDIRDLVDAVYSEIPENVESPDFEEWARKTFDDDILKGKATSVVFPTPSKECFFAADSGDYFYDESTDNVTFMDARTRIGESQIRIALLPEKFIKELSNYVTKAQAIMVLARSVSINKNSVIGIESPIYGKGLIAGVLMLPSDAKEFKFCHNNKTVIIREDAKLGIIIEGE